jgi:hypothetical protein
VGSPKCPLRVICKSICTETQEWRFCAFSLGCLINAKPGYPWVVYILDELSASIPVSPLTTVSSFSEGQSSAIVVLNFAGRPHYQQSDLLSCPIGSIMFIQDVVKHVLCKEFIAETLNAHRASNMRCSHLRGKQLQPVTEIQISLVSTREKIRRKAPWHCCSRDSNLV